MCFSESHIVLIIYFLRVVLFTQFKTTIPNNNYDRPKSTGDVKCFKYLGSMLTEHGRCTCEIKSRIVVTKAAFNKKKNFYQQIGLQFEEETSEVLRLEHSSVWY